MPCTQPFGKFTACLLVLLVILLGLNACGSGGTGPDPGETGENEDTTTEEPITNFLLASEYNPDLPNNRVVNGLFVPATYPGEEWAEDDYAYATYEFQVPPDTEPYLYYYYQPNVYFWIYTGEILLPPQMDISILNRGTGSLEELPFTLLNRLPSLAPYLDQDNRLQVRVRVSGYNDTFVLNHIGVGPRYPARRDWSSTQASFPHSIRQMHLAVDGGTTQALALNFLDAEFSSAALYMRNQGVLIPVNIDLAGDELAVVDCWAGEGEEVRLLAQVRNGDETQCVIFEDTWGATPDLSALGCVTQSGSIDVDGTGTTCLLLRGSNGNLYFARRNGAAWAVEPVAEGVIYYSNLVLDESGEPHLCYLNHSDLYYAWHSAAGWNTELVSTDAGYKVCLALGAGDTPYILATDNLVFGELTFYSRTRTGWAGEPIDEMEFESIRIDLDCLSDGRPVAVFSESAQQQTFLGIREPSGWELETVSPGYRSVIDLEIDDSDNIYLAYPEEDGFTLMSAR